MDYDGFLCFKLKRKEQENELQKKEDEELMKNKIEADVLYHMYEIEKNKHRTDKQKQVANANLKLAVRLSDRKYFSSIVPNSLVNCSERKRRY